MAAPRPAAIDAYIAAAPAAGQPHLRQLHALLQGVAPKAEQLIKWGDPFFVEPRFLFSVSAHKAHLSLAPSAEALQHFGAELKNHQTTKNFLKLPYGAPLPEALIRRIAQYRVKAVAARQDDAFW